MKHPGKLDQDMEKAYTFILAVSFVGVAILYGLMFDDFGQDALMSYAPLWVLPITFSLVGLVIEKFGDQFGRPHAEGSLRIAIIATLIVTLLWFVFANLVFPAL